MEGEWSTHAPFALHGLFLIDFLLISYSIYKKLQTITITDKKNQPENKECIYVCLTEVSQNVDHFSDTSEKKSHNSVLTFSMI